MGNLLPLLIWAPLVIGGLVIILRARQIVSLGVEMVAAGQVLGLVALNYLGLFENRSMKKAMMREFGILEPKSRGYSMFVGYASPSFSGFLDPHEDVGVLYLGGENVEFIGETRTLKASRKDVSSILLRPNVHSIVGLGGWVSIQGVAEGKAFEWRFEPRERDTLLGNRRLRKALRNHLLNWKKLDEPRTK